MSIDALQAKIRKLKNPSMIGLDSTVELLPPHLLEEAYRTHGQSLEALAAAYEIFCGEILQALQGLVPAVKVQSYCFDALGSCGIAAMQRLLRQAQHLGFYVMMDANYSSVGHISQLYAAAVFGGLRTPDAGTIRVAGIDPATNSPELRQILGMQLQHRQRGAQLV